MWSLSNFGYLQNRGHLSSYPVLNRTNWFFPLPSEGKRRQRRGTSVLPFYAFLEINGEGLGLVSLSLDWLRKVCMGQREGLPGKITHLLLGVRHESRWIGPGEQLWFSVPPKCVPHLWQVLSAGAALSSRGGSQTLRSERRERDARVSPGIQRGRDGTEGGGVRLNWDSGLVQLPLSSDSGAEPCRGGASARAVLGGPHPAAFSRQTTLRS